MVRVSESSSYRGFELPSLGNSNLRCLGEGKITSECITEIQGKPILVRVSARFELMRVQVIGSQLYLQNLSTFL